MAETSGFFNAEMIEDDGSTTYDRIYYADQFAYYFSKFISNGVYIDPATQLKVTSKGELKLNVAVGDAFINGYWYKNDENLELQLAQANGSLPRIDRIVLRWDSLTRCINIAILQGNPAATPSAKNLTRNADTWELGLADVYVERGVLSISDANITDLRPDRTYCGYVAGVVNQIDTTNLFAQFTDAFEQYYEKQVTTSDKFSSDLAKRYNDYAVLAETNFGKWMTDTKGDFDTWYETIQAMLSDEEAVKLANQIAELKKQFQLLALRGLKTDLFELASNDGSVFTENAQNAYVFLKQIYGKSELVNDAFISVGESGTLEFDSVDATNENVSSAKLTTGMPLRGFIIDDVSVANYTDANGKYWLCDSIELSVDGYWYCIKRVGSILSYSSEDVGTIYKTATGTLDEGKQVLYKLSDYVVSKLTDEEQSQLSELLSYGGGKLPATTGSNAAEAIQLHIEQNITDENGVHNIRFRNGSLQYKEGNEWKNIVAQSKAAVDGKTIVEDSKGVLSVSIDNATLVYNEVEKSVKVAVDTALSSTSTNPVQNKVVKKYIDDGVNALKKSVSDGKTKVANAITDKGVETATDATFDVMAENISKIETGGGELHGATLAVSTEESTLFGQTVTLTLDGASVATTVFADNGTCSFVVQNPGAYTIACGEAHKDATVTGDNVVNKTVISVELSLLKIVAFATGTDEEISAMIQAHYDNKINIADYWAVGDMRTVHLSAMAATGVGESHREQDVQFVIGDFNHDDLTTPINGHTKAAVTLLQKDCLMDDSNASNPVNGSGNKENGYMNSSATNVGGWKNCARRTWCNNVFFAALPSTWQSMVKTVNKKTSAGNNQSTIETVQDKIFLAAEIEIFGSTTYSFAGEGTQYQYYKNATANRYKMPKWSSSYVSHAYLERSPYSGYSNLFCVVDSYGSAYRYSANGACGVAPNLCI